MSFEGLTLYQVIGALALALITGGVLKMILTYWFSGEKRVSSGWERFGKNEERLRLQEREAHQKELDRRDAELLELEEENRRLRHALRNAETTVKVTSEVKALETQVAKEEIHQAVDASINKMTL